MGRDAYPVYLLLFSTFLYTSNRKSSGVWDYKSTEHYKKWKLVLWWSLSFSLYFWTGCNCNRLLHLNCFFFPEFFFAYNVYNFQTTKGFIAHHIRIFFRKFKLKSLTHNGTKSQQNKSFKNSRHLLTLSWKTKVSLTLEYEIIFDLKKKSENVPVLALLTV